MRNNKPKQRQTPGESKSPKQIAKPESSYCETPVWSFGLYDHDGRWTFSEDDFFGKILPHLKSRESQTWNAIFSQSGGKKAGHGSNSHSIPVSRLSKDAQDILVERRLDDCEVIVSLRLTNLERIWGLREGRVLRILWFDPLHEVCPSAK